MICVADTYAWLEFGGATHDPGSIATGAVVTDPPQVTRTKSGATGGAAAHVATWVGPALFLMQVTVLTPMTEVEPSTQNRVGVSVTTLPQVVTM